MAIQIEKKANTVNWLMVAIGMFTILFVATSVYFLFFSATPLIERIAPVEFKEVSTLSEDSEKLNPDVVLTNPFYISLQNYIAPPDPGTLGRANPFRPF